MSLFNGRIHRNPRKWGNPILLANAIDEYVDSVVGVETRLGADQYKYGVDKDGDIVWYDTLKKDGTPMRVYENPPSWGGLCLHLGLSRKSELINMMYEKNAALREIVASTILWLETFYVTEMQRPNASKAYEFLLSNMGWSAQKQIKDEATTPIQAPKDPTPAQQAPQLILNFVRSPNAKSEEEVRRELISAAGEDQALVESLIGKNQMKKIEAEVTQG